mmetsp:Transcript_36876/g.80942  ORF Transcript_36876/g.80942 Transcript_36876/m.80942 type:complete len:201 (+) Transcript_36876:295-897(+)
MPPSVRARARIGKREVGTEGERDSSRESESGSDTECGRARARARGKGRNIEKARYGESERARHSSRERNRERERRKRGRGGHALGVETPCAFRRRAWRQRWRHAALHRRRQNIQLLADSLGQRAGHRLAAHETQHQQVGHAELMLVHQLAVRSYQLHHTTDIMGRLAVCREMLTSCVLRERCVLSAGEGPELLAKVHAMI